MRVIEPIILNDTSLAASNVPEADHPVWSSGTTYAEGARVILGAPVHAIFEAIIANTGFDPVVSADKWLKLGATNRWRAFDQRISDPVIQAAEIRYTIQPEQTATPGALAFFGLSASTVQVVISSPSDGTIYDETRTVVDNSIVFDWYSYFAEPVIYDTEAIFSNLPIYVDAEIEVAIFAGGNAEVGQIVLGADRQLGRTLPGSEIGIDDYSTKERDPFGNAIIVERAFVQTARFNFAFPPDAGRRVQRILSRLRARPAVYYLGEGFSQYGLTVYGFYQDFNVPINFGASFATLEIEGLI